MHRRVLRLVPILACLLTATASAQTLRIGLAEDPDVLDPTLARSFVGRIVFASLCDKLFDIDEKLHIVPQLAASYEWSADSKALTIRLRTTSRFTTARSSMPQPSSTASSVTRRWRGPIAAASSPLS